MNDNRKRRGNQYSNVHAESVLRLLCGCFLEKIFFNLVIGTFVATFEVIGTTVLGCSIFGDWWPIGVRGRRDRTWR